MNSTPANNSGREKMQQILAAIGSKPAEISEQIEAADYDWQQPHCFSTIQIKRLTHFTERLSQACTENITRLYNNNYDVKILSTTQHFATELFSPDEEKVDYRIAFGVDEERPSGMVSIPVQSAINWTTQLLGGDESGEDSDRELSSLEESLLLDIASALIEAFPKAWENYECNPAQKIIRDKIPLELQGAKELCKINFNVTKAASDKSTEAYFVILCDELQPIVGKERQGPIPPAKAVSDAMNNHIHKIPILATAQLDSIRLTFEEIMGLKAGDILLLDKNVGEPIDLVTEDRILFQGQPAKSGGKNAILITEMCSSE